MKKKIMLLLTLIVSLFIYSSRVDAVVMWMECDVSEYNSALNGDDNSGSNLNGIAVINSYDDSNTSIRHVIFDNRNFFNLENSPTFIINQGGNNSSFEAATCWYQNNSATNTDDMIRPCKTINANPFINKVEFDKGYCPAAFYDSDADHGGTTGDFVYAAGKKKAIDTAELTEPNIAFYYSELIKGWIMEGYSSTGVYGFAFFYDSDSKLLGVDTTFDIYFNPIIGIGDGDDDNDVMDDNYNYDKEYVNRTQAMLIKKISRLGKKYFELDLANKFPGVLIPCNTSYVNDGIENCGNDTISKIHVYGQNSKEMWSEVDEWYNGSTKSLLEEIGSNYLKFPDPELKRSEVEDIDKTYYDLLVEAEKYNKKVESGKNNDLDVVNFDETALKLDNALKDLQSLKNSEGFPHYRRNTAGKCVADNGNKSPYADPQASLMEYVMCNTVENIDYSANIAANENLLKGIFLDILSRQISSKFGVNFNLFNINDIKERYAISFGKYASYLGEYYSPKLSDSQKKKLDSIIEKYRDYVRKEYNAEIVVNCDDLLGEDFLNKISTYVDIIKIAVPIILIGFGILDFTKAFFAGDEEKMRSAQKKFLMRIVIAILFFLLPFILKIILTIANKAWSFISPSGCNIM